MTPKNTATGRAVWSCLAIVTAGQLPPFLTGALAVQIRDEIGFDLAQVGLVISTYFVVSAATSAGAGHLVERLGWRGGLRLGGAVTAASLLIIALFAHSWTTLALPLSLAGVANAVGQPAANLALVRMVRPARHGLVFGIKQSSILVATLLGGLSVPAIALTIGWRWAFVFAAGGSVLAAVGVPGTRGRIESPSAGAGRSATSPNAAADPGGARAGSLGTTSTGLSRNAVRPLLLVAGAGCGGAMVGNAFGALLVTSAVAAGFGPGAAGLLLAVGSIAGLSVRIGMGWLADLRSFRPLRAMGVLLVLGSGGCLLLGLTAGPWFALGTVVGMGAGWGWPGLYNLAVVRQFPATAAFATGISQTGIYVGAALGPPIFGLLVDRVGFDWSWVATAGVAVASVYLAQRAQRAFAASR